MEAAGSTDLTVRHVLSMTMGTAWREEPPYADARNGEIAMELAADRDAYILSRQRIEPAGTSWRYSGGASALLGTLIEQGAGVPLAQFARDRLFEPLGIRQWQWMAGGDGRASPASGLRLTAPDLVRIGQLMLADGTWESRELVPASWLEESRVWRAPSTWRPDLAYGQHLYLGGALAPHGSGTTWYGGIGNGGQYLMVAPRAGLVGVVLTGAYDAAGPAQGSQARAVLEHVLGPAEQEA